MFLSRFFLNFVEQWDTRTETHYSKYIEKTVTIWVIFTPTKYGIFLPQHNMGYFYPNTIWEIFTPTQYGTFLAQHNMGHFYPNTIWDIFTPTQYGIFLPQHNMGHFYPTQYGTFLLQFEHKSSSILFSESGLKILVKFCWVMRIW